MSGNHLAHPMSLRPDGCTSAALANVCLVCFLKKWLPELQGFQDLIVCVALMLSWTAFPDLPFCSTRVRVRVPASILPNSVYVANKQLSHHLQKTFNEIYPILIFSKVKGFQLLYAAFWDELVFFLLGSPSLSTFLSCGAKDELDTPQTSHCLIEWWDQHLWCSWLKKTTSDIAQVVWKIKVLQNMTCLEVFSIRTCRPKTIAVGVSRAN